MNYEDESMNLHQRVKGKIEITSRVSVSSREELALAYTPGVAAPCLAIERDPQKSFELTRRWNTVAVVTDGSAVLGLGNIGPEAGMPVMEGKCVLFKEFANIDAIPLCIRSQDINEIVQTISLLAGSFGGINLEDISAPRCFEVERLLQEKCDIPVFHDDQHGTAIVVAAALINAAKVVGKNFKNLKVVHNGVGAAGTAIINMLYSMGLTNITAVDKEGILNKENSKLNKAHMEIAKKTNPLGITGTLQDALRGADVFIGTSIPGCLTKEMIRTMNTDPIIFACANPYPEISPEDALDAGTAIISTGRSDYPNQVNNVLVFPGLFRGALDANATHITNEMKVAAVHALASIVLPEELTKEYILPQAFDKRVATTVAAAVAKASFLN